MDYDGLMASAQPQPQPTFADLLKYLGQQYAPNFTGLVTGQPAAPIAELSGYGKVPQPDDPRFTSALVEGANVGKDFLGPPIKAAGALGLGALGLTKAASKAKAAAVPSLRGLPASEAITIARGEPHVALRGPGGNIAGGPDWINTAEDLAKMRADVDTLMTGGLKPGEADITGWNWYQRARDEGLNLSGTPENAKFTARLGGEYSPNAPPESELGYALKERNALITDPPRVATDEAGLPAMWKDTKGNPYPNRPELVGGVKPGRPQQHQNALEAIAANNPELMALGKKTGPYATKQGPEGVESARGSTGVNDFRMQQVLGYRDAEGNPVLSGNAPTLGPGGHRFMDYETTLAVDRANKMKLGGRSDWTGEQMQALLWVRNKAADLMKERGISWEAALDLANKQPFDYAKKHTAYATHEAIPGAPREFTYKMLEQPQATQDAYSLDPRSTWRGAGDRDTLYGGLRVGNSDLGMLVDKTTPMQGVWKPEGGGTQLNRGEVARPLVGVTEGRIDEASRAILENAERTRAYIDAQVAGAAHYINPKAKAGQMGSVDIPLDRPLTRDEASALLETGKPYGLTDISDRGLGVTMTNFANQPGGKATGAALKKRELPRAIAEALPEAGIPRRVSADGIYAPVDWGAEGSGQATRALLEELDKAPGVREALSANKEISPQARARAERDLSYAKLLGIEAPRDIQNARGIIGQGPGWVDRLRAALARGEYLPALAGLGVLPAVVPRQQ